MQLLLQTNYKLLNSEKAQIGLPCPLTIDGIWKHAEKLHGGKLWLHVFTEEEIHLYDRPLSEKGKPVIYYIVGQPRRGCCGG